MTNRATVDDPVRSPSNSDLISATNLKHHSLLSTHVCPWTGSIRSQRLEIGTDCTHVLRRYHERRATFVQPRLELPADRTSPDEAVVYLQSELQLFHGDILSGKNVKWDVGHWHGVVGEGGGNISIAQGKLDKSRVCQAALAPLFPPRPSSAFPAPPPSLQLRRSLVLPYIYHTDTLLGLPSARLAGTSFHDLHDLIRLPCPSRPHVPK